MGREIKGLSARWGFIALVSGVLALGVGGAQNTADYDELPAGPSASIAPLYYSALSLPGVSEWTAVEKAALLDVATLRYKDRWSTGRRRYRPSTRAHTLSDWPVRPWS